MNPSIGMDNDFLSIEKELQEITADFASGHMNAFGSKTTQDAFFRELKVIAEIEMQVFNKTCSIIKRGSEDDHAFLSSMFSSAQPPTPQGINASNKTHVNQTSRSNAAMAQEVNEAPEFHTTLPHRMLDRDDGNQWDEVMLHKERNPSHSVDRSPQPDHSTQESNLNQVPRSFASAESKPRDGVSNAFLPSENTEWNNDCGFSDKLFEKVEERFSFLEGEFSTLGNKLQDILKHVTQLNAMSHQMNEGHGMGSSDDDVT